MSHSSSSTKSLLGILFILLVLVRVLDIISVYQCAYNIQYSVDTIVINLIFFFQALSSTYFDYYYILTNVYHTKLLTAYSWNIIVVIIINITKNHRQHFLNFTQSVQWNKIEILNNHISKNWPSPEVSNTNTVLRC